MVDRQIHCLAMHCLALVATVCLGATGATRLGVAAEGLPKLISIELTDLVGCKHVLGKPSESQLTVLVFLGTECPVSNGYAPSLNRLHAAHTASGVRLLGVHSDPDVDAAIARTHAKDYELQFPVVLDHDQRLAEACGVRKVPTALLIAADGQLLYRGRIDNRYLANGARRPQATEFDLNSALKAALAGQQPDPATTEIFGCPLPRRRQK
jgi:peroxiredoxin